MILWANHLISKRRSSYLFLGVWIWTGWSRAYCIYTRAAFSYRKLFDNVTRKINPCVEQIAIRSMIWDTAQMGWVVYGLLVWFLWTSGQSDWNPGVVQNTNSSAKILNISMVKHVGSSNLAIHLFASLYCKQMWRKKVVRSSKLNRFEMTYKW